MCGICGIFSFKGHPIERSMVMGMADIMSHRGPDGSGYFIDGPIGLGHRRLSIIDIGGGSQPMSNEDDTLQVVFNGEIYNYIELKEHLKKKGHVFKTTSDTEVILHAYEETGTDCIKNFNGIFSFALWDSKQQRLFIARDHLGVKPLYYTLTGDRLSFASEIKSLLVNPACRREVDIEALGSLFTYRFVPSPDTLFQDIKKLPPGCFLIANAEGYNIRRYWTRIPVHLVDYNENALTEQYQYLFEDAVRLQLRSDVPVGLFLSSGVDSGAILSCMRKQMTGTIHTFTIGFEDGEKTNETDDARSMARLFETQHDEMMVSSKDYEDYYSRYLWDIEEPVGNESAAAFYFVSLIANRKVKVALSGQGADEPWAGYHRYIGVKLSALYARLPHLMTDGMIRPLINLLPGSERLKRGVASLSEPNLLNRFSKIYSFYDDNMKQRLFKPWIQNALKVNGNGSQNALSALQSEVSHLDPVSQMLYIDTRMNLPDDLLMVGDKTSMANSLEARVPFLDYRLVEFIESLPPQLKLKGFQGKYLHKKAIEKWLPNKVVYGKKKGFANPVKEWLKGRMSGYVNECLLSSDSSVNRYFEKSYIRELIEQHASGREDYLRHLYLLISFELWHRRFFKEAIA